MESQRIRLSLVNYLNARPFSEGLKLLHPKIEFELSEDIPSLCAEKLEKRQVDIGLIPVAKIKDIPTSSIITSYCIAADGPVDSVVLVSHKPLEHITEVTLDTESRTSVMLAKILALEFWKIQPKWTKQGPQHDFARADTIESAVMIGDKALLHRHLYPYCYDLAEAWKNFTGLPFVFAAWVCNTEIPQEFIDYMDIAFDTGMKQKKKIAQKFQEHYPGTDILNYLDEKIKYELGSREKSGLELFLQKCENLPADQAR